MGRRHMGTGADAFLPERFLGYYMIFNGLPAAKGAWLHQLVDCPYWDLQRDSPTYDWIVFFYLNEYANSCFFFVGGGE